MAKNPTIASLVAKLAVMETSAVEDRTHFTAALKLVTDERDALMAENKDLKANLAVASEMVLKLGGVKKVTVTQVRGTVAGSSEADERRILPAQTPGVEIAPTEKIVPCMRWALKRIGFKSNVTDEFLLGFDVHVNKTTNWFGFTPKGSGNRETVAFQREVTQCLRNLDMKGNYWKNDGVWFNY